MTTLGHKRRNSGVTSACLLLPQKRTFRFMGTHPRRVFKRSGNRFASGKRIKSRIQSPASIPSKRGSGVFPVRRQDLVEPRLALSPPPNLLARADEVTE